MSSDNELTVCVVETNGSGGLMHYAYQMCTAFADAGAAVTLVTATDYELHQFPHNFQVEPILHLWAQFDTRQTTVAQRSRVARLRYDVQRVLRRIRRGVRLVREWFRLTRYILQHRPDVVQMSMVHFPFETFFFAWLRRKNFLLAQVCHEFERRERDSVIGRWMNRLYASSYDHFSAIFFHAEDNRNRFLSLFDIPPARTHVIVHGNEKLFLTHAAQISAPVSPRTQYGLTAEETVVLFFGLLSPSKGVPDLVQAFAQVAAQNEARLVIAGYPTKFFNIAGLKKQVTQLGLEDRVIFDLRYLPIEEVAPLIEMAALLVFPYRSSTQSGALQVAYAFGRPVIASDIGGLPEVVEDGRSGYLVPPQNPDALAEKILLMLDNPEQTADMGRYAQQLSETRYAWDPVAEYILGVYREVLDTGQVSD